MKEQPTENFIGLCGNLSLQDVTAAFDWHELPYRVVSDAPLFIGKCHTINITQFVVDIDP